MKVSAAYVKFISESDTILTAFRLVDQFCTFALAGERLDVFPRVNFELLKLHMKEGPERAE